MFYDYNLLPKSFQTMSLTLNMNGLLNYGTIITQLFDKYTLESLSYSAKTVQDL